MAEKKIEKTEKKETKKKEPDRYIYTPDAVFRGDILDTHDEDDMSERRKKRLEEGRKKKERSEAAKKRIRRGFIFALGIVGVFAIFFATVGTRFMKLMTLRSEVKAKQEQLQQLQSDVQKNEDILEQVNSDEYIEQKARSEFNMIKDGEILYKIDTKGDSAADSDASGNPGTGSGQTEDNPSGASDGGSAGSN